MKGFGIGNQRLQHNIVDLFPGIPTDPDRWSLHREWTWMDTHTQSSKFFINLCSFRDLGQSVNVWGALSQLDSEAATGDVL